MSVALMATLFLGTGCSVRDSGRSADASASADQWTEGSARSRLRSDDSLSRDARRALRDTATRPEDAPDIWSRARLGFAFTDDLNHPRVQPFIRHYRDNPNIIQVSSARAEPFAYFILTEIERRGLPGELLLLPIVESGYAPEATSSGLAAGIWQFIPSTGESFGLIQDDWYDGRRDVYQSTHAALDYLERLYARFGDWYLALAAYNHGQGNVARAMAANAASGKPTDYWNLRLSSEAMAYVPRMLALRALFDKPARYGVTLPVIANQPYLEPVQLGRQADLEYVAELARMESREIVRLNPGYRRQVTHPHAAQHLMLPAPAAERLQTVLRQRRPDDPLMRYGEYRVVAGDNLGQIARHHGVSVSELRSANRLQGDLIRVGQQLRIPLSGNRPTVATTAASRPSTGSAVSSTYTVQAGDSLWAISQRHGISIAGLRSENGIGNEFTLQPGQVLRLPSAPKVANGTRRMEYRIRPGDSLAAISRRFQVDIVDVQRWNALPDHSIRAGETLTLYVATNLAVDG